ncbi:MAG TPA: proline dehydrogenase family protein [Acidimicrobiales bacterium]
MNPLRSAILAASQSDRVRRTVESVGATRRVVDRFVAGQSTSDALECVHRLTGDGLLATVDHLGEEVTDAAGADATVDAYVSLLDALATKDLARGSDVSVKLTALGLAVDAPGARDRALRILDAARDAGATMTIDMEHSTLTDVTIETVQALRERDPSVAAVLQAMLRRTEADARALAGEGARIRLCKGAYAEDADVAFQRRAEVDEAYRRCLAVLFSSACTPLVATHDPAMVTAALELAAAERRDPSEYELQMLLGVRPDEQLRLQRLGLTVRVYVPFGTQWWGYLMRRLAERPANLAFFARALATRG